MRRFSVSPHRGVIAAFAMLLAVGASACSQKAPALSEAASELVQMQPTSVNFGDVQVGAAGGPAQIRIYASGVGDSYDRVTSVSESCANFSYVADNLPYDVYKYCIGGGGQVPRSRGGAGESQAAPIEPNAPICDGYEFQEYAFTVSFQPTVAGQQSCVVTVMLDGGPRTVMLTGNGLPPPREIDVSRSSIAFGDVRRGAMSTPQTVVVSNTGSAALTISSASVTGTAFAMSGPASTTIAGGSSQTYTLVCAPGTTLGPLSGSFRITSDDPDEGTLTLPLSCAGVDSNLTVEPSPIALAARVDEPREVMVNLVNSGGASMQVTAVTIAGDDLELVTAPTGAIPAGGSMQARVRYMARGETDVSGMLSVAYDGQMRSVPVSARAKRAELSISPDGEVDLGAICVGNSKEQAFTALGAGGAGFVVSTVQVTGEGFTLGSAAGPFNIAGAGASPVTLRALVNPTAAGKLEGTLELTTDIPAATPRTIRLTALAIAQGVGASPAEHDFSSILVNEPSNVQPISIANCSGAVLAISGVTIEGVDAADFRVITEPSKSIAPSGTSSMLIEMRPRTPGLKEASLVIAYEGGSTVVPLTGDGFLPKVEVERIGTYYSCQAQAGAGAWLLGLGLAALLWSRRRRA